MITQSTTQIMGILNVTPDSFSDGGQFTSVNAALAHAKKMVASGAHIIDVGGESTRPGSDFVSDEEELNRVVPVIEAISSRMDVKISVDTTKPQVADAALTAGASMVNDVSMLRYDTALADVAAKHDATLVLMHSRKRPKDMQHEIGYSHVVRDVISELLQAVATAVQCGVPENRIWLDPGIGFAKTAAQNLSLIAGTRELVACGYPVLTGPSRKSFIGAYTGAGVNDRIGGTAAAVSISVFLGAHAVRVHDISLMKQTADISALIRENQLAEDSDG